MPYLIYTPIIGVMIVMGYAFNPEIEDMLGTEGTRIILWFTYQMVSFTAFITYVIYNI